MRGPSDPGASGTWRGFYVYAPGGRRHRMRLDLAFGAGTLTGGGSDDVGRFTIHGGFDPEGVRVWWTKRYVGAHEVWYEGVRDGTRGRAVYGGWSIGAAFSGGFRIWRGEEAVDLVAGEAAVESPAEDAREYTVEFTLDFDLAPVERGSGGSAR